MTSSTWPRPSTVPSVTRDGDGGRSTHGRSTPVSSDSRDDVPAQDGAPEVVRWLTATEQRAWRNWISGTTVLFRSLERELQHGYDITMDDYALLVLLSEADRRAVRMSVLADEAIVPRPQVTYRISRLEKRGLVERRPCEEDARGTEAHLTDEGFALLERAARLHVTNVRELFLDHLTDDEFATLGEAMGRIHDHIADGSARRA